MASYISCDDLNVISCDGHVTPGVYLPLLWEVSFCWKTPIALAYTRGHFSALVAMTASQPSGAEVHSNISHDNHVMYLPLTDNDGHLLQVHFLTEQEVSCHSYCICNLGHAWFPCLRKPLH